MRVLAVALAIAAYACGAQPIRVGVFGLFHPRTLEVSGSGLTVEAGARRFPLGEATPLRCSASANGMDCTAGSETFVADRVSVVPRGTLVLSVPGRIRRTFAGTLEITRANGELIPVITMDLETAVAAATAAESPVGAPFEALKAQAIVIRSYYRAARARHVGFDFCDTTHCQFLRSGPAQRSEAGRAAAETRGMVVTWNGRPLDALYSARCGGRTHARPHGDDEYPFYSVACPCVRAKEVRCSYCVRTTGAWANRRGTGAGHGTGLCQAGATVMASEGASFQSILQHYFPNTDLRTIE